MATKVEAVFASAFAAWGLPASFYREMFDKWVTAGADDTATQVIAEEIKTTAEFKARFPKFHELEQEGRAVSVGDWLNYENALRESLNILGPEYREKFSTPQRVGEMLFGEVSIDEARDRIQMASYASTTAPKSVQEALAARYGLTPGDMAAYWLEPDETTAVLQTRMGAARLVGAASEYGLGTAIDTQYAEELAKQGVDYGEAKQGMSQAAQQRELEGEQGVTTGDLVRGKFGDENARRRVTRAQQARRGRFSGGGGAEQGREGISGLGDSSNT